MIHQNATVSANIIRSLLVVAIGTTSWQMARLATATDGAGKAEKSSATDPFGASPENGDPVRLQKADHVTNP